MKRMNKVIPVVYAVSASLAVIAAAGCAPGAGSTSDEGTTAVTAGSATPAAAGALATIHTRDVVRDGTAVALGRVPSDHVMSLHIVLPLSDRAGLDAFVADVSNPASANYRQYLSVQEFTAPSAPRRPTTTPW